MHSALRGLATLIVLAISAPALAQPSPDAQAASATSTVPAAPVPDAPVSVTPAPDPFARFTPTDDPIRHRIVYEVFDFALQAIVTSMGPSNRSAPYVQQQPLGTRLRQGHNSRYRLEGSLVGFVFLDEEVITSFTTYREELQAIGDTIPIHTLPRDEQLAFWFNLHNVAMLEQIGQRWPLRQPREIEVDGVPLDDARFITVEGVTMSLRDIRERIVFANWRDPKVIYGFWRGEIGGPALQTMAFNSSNVGPLLDYAASEFVNSLRGTEKRGDTLHVSELYEEVAPFYFVDFDADLRAHIARYAEEEVTGILGETTFTRASISEHDIADLSGGSRGANYLSGSSSGSRPGIPPGVVDLLRQRQRKFEVMQRREELTGQVFFSNIRLPGDPPNLNAVE